MSRNQRTQNKALQDAYDAALAEARRGVSLGAVRLRAGAGLKHERFIGDARLEITYRGPDKSHRPMYRVVIFVRTLRHKISVGGAANWHEQHGLPSSPAAIDEIARAAVSFATSDASAHAASTIEEATQSALRENGTLKVRNSA